MFSRTALLGALIAIALSIVPASASAALVYTCPSGVDHDTVTPLFQPQPDVVPPSCFEAGDGNQVVDRPGIRSDWESFTTPAAQTLVSGQDDLGVPDLRFQGGNAGKEDDPGHWQFATTGSLSPKANIYSAATYADPTTDDVFVYFAFEREDGSGNASINFEFNQAVNADGTPRTFTNAAGQAGVPFRTEGDILTTFDGNESNGVVIGMCRWVGDQNSGDWYRLWGDYTQPPPAANKVTPSKSFCTPLPPPASLGSMNSTPTENFLPNWRTAVGDDIGKNLFGEAAVNLSEALRTVGNPDPCFSFGSLWMRSRSSSAITSDLQDYVAPHAIPPVASCSIEVDKDVSTDGGTTYTEGTPADPSVATVDATALTYRFEVLNDGSVPVALNTFNDPKCDAPVDLAAPVSREHQDGLGVRTPDLTTGSFDPDDVWTYSCVHTLVPGDPSPLPNTVDIGGLVGAHVVSGSDSTATTLLGRVVIEKQTSDGAKVASFGFTESGLGGGGFSLADDGQKRYDVAAGAFAVSETQALHDGYRFGSVDCDDADSTQTSTTPTAAIAVAPRETVTCTFTNDKLNGALSVVKTGPAQAHDEDSVTYRFAVTNTGNSDLSNVAVADDKCTGTVTRDAASDQNADGDATLDWRGTPDATKGETWAFTCTYTLAAHAAGEADPIVNTATATGDDEDGDSVTPAKATHSTDLLHPSLLVTKTQRVGSGPYSSALVEVDPGNVIDYEITLKNTGDIELSGVSAIDDATLTPDGVCDAAPVYASGNAAPLATLDVGESWVYHCSHVVTAGDKNAGAVRNEAYGQGTDPLGKPVSHQAGISAPVKTHPAIDIEKSGPGSATAGDRLDYVLVVTNPGDVAFASQQVIVTDPECDAPPLLVATTRGAGADPTPQQLDPGDAWRYTCSRQTLVGEQGVLNVARVDGTDPLGRKVSDTDDVPTVLTQPEGQVLPETAEPGSSRLSGPAACQSKAFKVRVRGKQIAKAVFYLDGKKYKTLSVKASQAAKTQTLSITINPRTARAGVHRVRVRVTYVAEAKTKAKTMNLAFQRCARQAVKPDFTG